MIVKIELMELIGLGCVLDRPEAAEGWRPAWRTAVSTRYSEQIENFLKFWDTHPDFKSSLLVDSLQLSTNELQMEHLLGCVHLCVSI